MKGDFIMSIANCYDYIRKYIDKSFVEHSLGLTSFSSEEAIADIQYDIIMYGENKKIMLYYDYYEGYAIFDDWDMVDPDFEIDKPDKPFLITTLKHALNILKLQNNLFNETIEEMEERGR